MVTTRLRPSFAAHSASGTVTWAAVKLDLTMKGDCSGMIEVAAAMTTSGTFAWVASGAVARARGVRPKPARTVTLS